MDPHPSTSARHPRYPGYPRSWTANVQPPSGEFSGSARWFSWRCLRGGPLLAMIGPKSLNPHIAITFPLVFSCQSSVAEDEGGTKQTYTNGTSATSISSVPPGGAALQTNTANVVITPSGGTGLLPPESTRLFAPRFARRGPIIHLITNSHQCPYAYPIANPISFHHI